MMYHIFLAISIAVVVSGQKTSIYSTTFLDRDVNVLIEQLYKISFENKEIVNFNSKILRENENFKNLIQNLADKNMELERRVNLIEHRLPVSNNQRKKHGFRSNIQGNLLYKNLTNTAKMNFPMLMSKKIKNNKHIKDKRQVKRGTSGTVAFHTIVKDTLQNIGDNQEIPFKTVVVDTHNAFHADSGIFTTPTAGYYAFFATLLTSPGTRIDFVIAKNGLHICFGYSKGLPGDDEVYGTGSTSGIAYLDVGDKIWVKVNSNGHFGSGNMVYKLYSSFMGYIF